MKTKIKEFKTNGNKHHLRCPNNKNPFDELVNFGFD